MQQTISILSCLFLTIFSQPILAQNTFENVDNIPFTLDSSFKEVANKSITEIFLKEKPKSFNILCTTVLDTKKKLSFNPLPNQINTIKSPTQLFDDLKSKVYLVGIYSIEKKGTPQIDIIASAYCIQKNGLFLTNYHVLKPIIENKIKNTINDSIYYFIESYDGYISFIDNIINYDQANDISIFNVNNQTKNYNTISIGATAPVGESVYCLSNPENNYFYFSQGYITRNYIKPFDDNGTIKKKYIMSISADYAGGSSGSPIVDSCGNLIGMVSSTIGVYSGYNGHGQIQMVLKNAIPLYPIKKLLKLKH